VTQALLIATTTGYQIRSFGAAAEALGVRLRLASDRCHQLDDPWRDGAIAVRFHEPRASAAAVAAAFGDRPPAGVLAVGDRPAVLAAYVAEALGLRGNPPGAAEASRSKLASRQALAAAGLPVPAFLDVSLAAEAGAVPDVTYPVVVKPLALSGSRGVMRADDRAGLVAALDRLRRLLEAPEVAGEREVLHTRALIESFVPGREYAVEGVLTAGRFRPFVVFDKPDPLDGPVFEESIYVTPSRADAGEQAAIVAQVEAAARALGLAHGPVHAECRVNEAGVFVLEVAARPIGGLCARAIRFEDPRGAPASLEAVLLRHAVGEPIDDYRLARGASGVMMIPIPRGGLYRGVRGVTEAAAVPGVEAVEVTARPDTVLVPLPEGRSYLGFIFARAETAVEAERALRAAHARLEFRIDRAVTMAG
jgi:biotin carboxylase